MLLNADMIKQQRQQRGWTQEHVAVLCDISVRTVQRAEKTGIASMETTQSLAVAFSVEYMTLLADGGVKRAHSSVSVTHLIVLGSATFVMGLTLGAIFL